MASKETQLVRLGCYYDGFHHLSPTLRQQLESEAQNGSVQLRIDVAGVTTKNYTFSVTHADDKVTFTYDGAGSHTDHEAARYAKQLTDVYQVSAKPTDYPTFITLYWVKDQILPLSTEQVDHIRDMAKSLLEEKDTNITSIFVRIRTQVDEQEDQIGEMELFVRMDDTGLLTFDTADIEEDENKYASSLTNVYKKAVTEKCVSSKDALALLMMRKEALLPEPPRNLNLKRRVKRKTTAEEKAWFSLINKSVTNETKLYGTIQGNFLSSAASKQVSPTESVKVDATYMAMVDGLIKQAQPLKSSPKLSRVTPPVSENESSKPNESQATALAPTVKDSEETHHEDTDVSASMGFPIPQTSASPSPILPPRSPSPFTSDLPLPVADPQEDVEGRESNTSPALIASAQQEEVAGVSLAQVKEVLDQEAKMEFKKLESVDSSRGDEQRDSDTDSVRTSASGSSSRGHRKRRKKKRPQSGSSGSQTPPPSSKKKVRGQVVLLEDSQEGDNNQQPAILPIQFPDRLADSEREEQLRAAKREQDSSSGSVSPLGAASRGATPISSAKRTERKGSLNVYSITELKHMPIDKDPGQKRLWVFFCEDVLMTRNYIDEPQLGVEVLVPDMTENQKSGIPAEKIQNLVPGAKEMLKDIKDSGDEVCIVTTYPGYNDSEQIFENTEQFLKENGIKSKSSYDCLQGYVSPSKNDPILNRNKAVAAKVAGITAEYIKKADKRLEERRFSPALDRSITQEEIKRGRAFDQVVIVSEDYDLMSACMIAKAFETYNPMGVEFTGTVEHQLRNCRKEMGNGPKKSKRQIGLEAKLAWHKDLKKESKTHLEPVLIERLFEQADMTDADQLEEEDKREVSRELEAIKKANKEEIRRREKIEEQKQKLTRRLLAQEDTPIFSLDVNDD
ncbi:hypothetical protein [Parashewanella tropica]|uniref:hypothetical protein n=1 Tax=Parashewanella tropica TaxID=2547970 RepID=UPI00105A4D8F|nr:hypothetical protein [Parashewanella tropica]